MNAFATLVRNRRLQLGKTQRQIAEAVGIKSSDFICLIEKGTRRLDLDRLPRLAQALELDLVELCRPAFEARAPQLAAALFAVPSVQEVQQ